MHVSTLLIPPTERLVLLLIPVGLLLDRALVLAMVKGSKRSRTSRAVRISGPAPYTRSDGPPSRKTFRSQVVRTNEISQRQVSALRQYELNVSSERYYSLCPHICTHKNADLDEETVRVLAAARGDPTPAQDLTPELPFETRENDGEPGEGDEDAWEDMEDGVEAGDDDMQELLDFACVFLPDTHSPSPQHPIASVSASTTISVLGANVWNGKMLTGTW